LLWTYIIANSWVLSTVTIVIDTSVESECSQVAFPRLQFRAVVCLYYHFY